MGSLRTYIKSCLEELAMVCIRNNKMTQPELCLLPNPTPLCKRKQKEKDENPYFLLKKKLERWMDASQL